jgi:FdhD protein
MERYADAVRRIREWRAQRPGARSYSLLTAGLARSVRVLSVSPDGSRSRADVVAAEEPLEVRVDGEPIAVIMRTPGADGDLAAGFLHSERVIRSAGDIRELERHPDSRNLMNVRVTAAESTASALSASRRVVMNSSCGLCGRVTIESLRVDAPPVAADWTVHAGVIARLPEALRRAQAVFDETGGLHAAALFDPGGNIEAIAEDIGRHNAVDKVIGRMLLSNRLPLDRAILFVSGRTSFEILQKAFLAGIPVVGAVSAPSSLAVELADDAGITLLGFVRDAAFNVYSHARRIVGTR